MQLFLKTLHLSLCLLLPLFVTAQIVNIEDKRANLSDTTAVYGQVNLGFNLVENGNTIISINSGANVEMVKNKHWFLSLTNFNFFQADKEDFVNDGFHHFRYNYQLGKAITYESFTQIQYNEKISLRLRWLIGTGLRIALLKKEKQNVFFGLSYMYEYNEETNPEIEFTDHRMSSYLSFSFQPLSNVTISNTTYYQPVFDQLSDYRISSQAALVIKLTSKLLFTSNFSYTYDAEVPEGVVSKFYSLTNGLRWNF